MAEFPYFSEAGHSLLAKWYGRTLLEKMLLTLISICLIIIMALSITIGVHHRDEVLVYYRDVQNVTEHNDIKNDNATTQNDNATTQNDTKADIQVCTSKVCVTEAADLLNSIDPGVRPCDDFYRYACGTWINESTIISKVMDRFSTLTDRMNLKVKELLETQYADENQSLPEHFRKAKTFYETCKKWASRDNEGLEPFLQDIEYFGGYPAIWGETWNHAAFDYVTVMGRMIEKGYDNGVLLSVSIVVDIMNSSNEVIQIHQTTPGLSQVSLFQDPSVVDLYTVYTVMYANTLCLNISNCTWSTEAVYKELNESVSLELSITQMLSSPDILIDPENFYNKMPVKDLFDSAPEVDWLGLIKIYLPNVTITNETEIVVTTPSFMRNFSSLIGSEMATAEGKRRLANYMVYRQVKEIARHLTRDMHHTFYDFQQDISEYIMVPDLWEECISFTTALFDLSIGSQYIKRFLPQTRKKAIEELVGKLKAEMEIIINQTSWMDPVTKAQALTKLHRVYLMAVYPEDLMDETKLNIWYENMTVEKSHYNNYKNGNQFLFNKILNGFGEPVDRTSWKYLPSSLLEANAYYSSDNNSIWIPLGIAQDWFFEENGPDFVNYGRMGFVLGHELSHAFDTQGAKIDEMGNWRNWWQNETLVMFKNRSSCMSSIFDNYTVPEVNLTINGTRTITENIADDIGISEIYRVYRKIQAEKQKQSLPGLNLTDDQLFWINYATIWCEKDASDYYENLIQTDVHSPSKYRVNSPLSNNQGFIRDFNCKEGDRMFRETECHVWGTDS